MNNDNKTETNQVEFQTVLHQCSSRTEILNILEDCEAKHLIVQNQGEAIPLKVLISCLKHLEEIELDKLAEQRKHQLQGIKKALDLKKSGKGSYGRPQAKLPKDFETVVRHHLEEGIPLNKYREKIGMKCSTFYKKVSELK